MNSDKHISPGNRKVVFEDSVGQEPEEDDFLSDGSSPAEKLTLPEIVSVNKSVSIHNTPVRQSEPQNQSLKHSQTSQSDDFYKKIV